MSQFFGNYPPTGAGATGIDSFSIFQTPFGTSPTATGANQTLSFTSADGTVIITGDALTDTIDFSVPSAVLGLPVNSIQYNNGTSLAGSSNLLYNPTTSRTYLLGIEDGSALFSIDPNNRILYDTSGITAALEYGSSRALINSSGSPVLLWSATNLQPQTNIDFGTIYKGINLPLPINPGDSASKQYVDNAVTGLQPQGAVEVATTANITLSGLQTIDGYTTLAGDRVLVKNQASGVNDGVYIAASGAWARSSDFAVGINSLGYYIAVLFGTTNGNKAFIQTANPGIVGTNSLTFVLFNNTLYAASGLGITLSGNVFNLQIDGTTLSQSVSGVKVATSGITDNEISATAAIQLSKLGLLVGYSSTTGTVSPSDTVVQAISILNGNQAALVTGVSSVTNSDSTLTISPTTGAVVASLNVGHANTWSAKQTFGASANFSSLTASQALILDGSNNVISYPYSSLPGSTNSLVALDTNGNTHANNFESANQFPAAVGTITLTAASARIQTPTSGSGTCTIVLPDATTLHVGHVFEINNNGSGVCTIQANGGGTLFTIPSGGYAIITCTSISFPAGQWDRHFLMPSNANYGTAGMTVTGTLTSTGVIGGSNLSGTNTGDITLGTANGLSLAAQVLSLGTASTSTTGALTSTDWNTFNSKQSALTFGNLTDAGTDGISITNGTGAVIGTGTSISQQVATTSQNGYLSSTDWNTFNNKQSTLTFSDSLVNTSGTVTLKNDTATPAASSYYGTNGSSTLGYYTLSSILSPYLPLAGGTMTGQINWGTGLGAITHLLGPSDQALNISAQTPSSGVGNAVNITSGAGVSAASGAITISSSATGTATGATSLTSGAGAANSGNVIIGSGSATNTSGTVTISSGNAATVNTVKIAVGNATNTITPSTLTIQGGNSLATTGTAGVAGGQIQILGGYGYNLNSSTAGTAGASGAITIQGQPGGTTAAASSTGGAGASLNLKTGAGGNSSGATSTGGNAGNLVVSLGTAGTGTSTNGTAGQVSITQTLSGSDNTSMLALSPTLNTTGSSSIISISATDTASGSATKWFNATNGTSNTYFGKINTAGGTSGEIALFSTNGTNSLTLGMGNGGAVAVGLGFLKNGSSVALTWATSNVTVSSGSLYLGGSGGSNQMLGSQSAGTAVTSLKIGPNTVSSGYMAMTSGNQIDVAVGASSNYGFSPTSGTATWTNLQLGGPINQTGGANGNVTGIYFNPTITSLGGTLYAFNSTAGQLKLADTVGAGSGSLANGLLNLTQTWNTTGAPSAIKLNITNTSSGATSKLIDLQVNSVSKFNVDKNGNETNNTVTPTAQTFATLPGSPATGAMATITDSTVNTWSTAVTTGGGSFTVLIWYNGTNWKVYGA